MQTNITHYEDMMQLEDDILCFLPTVSDIDVFGCEVDLIDFATQLLLPAALHTALMQQRKLQIVVRPCMVKATQFGNSKKVITRTAPKQFESPSIRVEKLLTGLSMQHLCSGMWRLLKECSM